MHKIYVSMYYIITVFMHYIVHVGYFYADVQRLCVYELCLFASVLHLSMLVICMFMYYFWMSMNNTCASIVLIFFVFKFYDLCLFMYDICMYVYNIWMYMWDICVYM